jgi:chemotaxis protein histidine kinase CheA
MADDNDNTPDANSPVRVFNLPNKLKQKASKPGGKSFDDLVAGGDKIVQRVSMNYKHVVEGDVQQLVSMMHRMRTKPAEIDPQFKGIFRVAHDIKGQAGTFGYPLITRVAGSLTSFVDKFEKLGMPLADNLDSVIALFEVHVNTLQLMVAQDSKGAGGPFEAKLLDGLQGASERTLRNLEAKKAASKSG